MFDTLYTVWVGGTEVVAFYKKWEEASLIAKKYIDKGYDDVAIQKVSPRK